MIDSKIYCDICRAETPFIYGTYSFYAQTKTQGLTKESKHFCKNCHIAELRRFGYNDKEIEEIISRK